MKSLKLVGVDRPLLTVEVPFDVKKGTTMIVDAENGGLFAVWRKIGEGHFEIPEGAWKAEEAEAEVCVKEELDEMISSYMYRGDNPNGKGMVIRAGDADLLAQSVCRLRQRLNPRETEEKPSLELSSTRTRILDAFARHGTRPLRSMVSYVGLSRETTGKHLRYLVSKRLLTRRKCKPNGVTGRRAYMYSITEKGRDHTTYRTES
jgi:DNA-binding MarR family transcriptional regulator